MSQTEEYEIVRFYRTSKYPLMMGRLPDGTKIFGGPYTAAQGITGAATIMGALFTWGLWANFGLFGNIIMLAASVIIPVYLAGMIRTKNRNPIMLAAGAIGAWNAPSGGKLANAPLKFRKPHHVTGSAPLSDQPSEAHRYPDEQPVPVSAQKPRQEAAAPQSADSAGGGGSTRPETAPPARAVTAIERLMSQSAAQK